jgi:hypothetical protein
MFEQCGLINKGMKKVNVFLETVKG